MSVLALDYGRVRVGLAVCDDEGLSVRGLPTLDRRRIPDLCDAVMRIAREQNARRVVMGLPLGADESETGISREVREFAGRVRAALGLPVDFVEESFTSRAAGQLLQSRRRTERRDKGAVDRLAACLLLEAYLRERPSLSGPGPGDA